MGSFKVEALRFVREKVMSKLQGQKQNLLSEAGKEELIKAAASTMPTYFKVPVGLCDRIVKEIRKF